MSAFLVVMLIGIVGLVLMAIPGLNRHGHSIQAAGHGAAHGLGHSAPHTAGTHVGTRSSGSTSVSGAGGAAKDALPSSLAGMLRWIPSPRMVFSLMTLYGGFGIALADGAHVSKILAALLAILPAALIERFAVTPCWNMLMTFEGIPSSPLEELTFQEAEAVTPFRNGKGMVSVNRDGREVQFRATLPDDQSSMPVRVGDKLRIEQVDAEHERVTVSLNV